MEYHFRYSLTADDFSEYNAYTSWHAPWQRKARLIYAIRIFIYCGVSIIATFIILSKIDPLKSNHYQSIPIAGVIINLLLTWIYYYQAPFTIKRKARKILMKEENQHFLAENELSVNENNIISVDKLTTTKYSWESIVQYAITNEYFYLYTNTIQALVIPKRLFKTNTEIESFDKFLTGKVPLATSFRSMGI